MSASEMRTVPLRPEQAAYVESKVTSGAYASASEVVEAGLRALMEREETFEHWLRSEVGAAYDAMAADPGRAIPAETVFAEIRSRHAERVLEER